MKRKLRNYLIDKKMQLKITIKYLLLAIVSSFLTGVIVYVTIWPVLKGYVPYVLVDRLQYQIVTRLLYYCIPLILVITVCCIIMTHQIAGPLYNIEQNLDKLIRGEDVERIVIRDGDELKNLVTKINDLIPRMGKGVIVPGKNEQPEQETTGHQSEKTA
ncbi:MAG: methyl-accepting chemotaxis protein [Desulfobacteraceae bacterium]|nr:methyl-accepting chemotaxis protein [Desulfobacteraceae bacterium]